MASSSPAPGTDTPRLTAADTARYREKVEEAAAFLRDRVSLPAVTVVAQHELGLADAKAVDTTIPYAEIPHLPVLPDPSAPSAGAGDTEGRDSSRGALRVGSVDGSRVALLDGPPSLLDGASPRAVTFPMRVLAVLGMEVLVVVTSAVGLDPDHREGDLLLVTDHINLQGSNPLVGPNVDDWGPRFPDMSNPYDPDLRRRLADGALAAGTPLHKGIYLAVAGPEAPTAAEARMHRTLGADVVGTTLVPETLVARHMSVRVAGLAVLDAVARPEAPASPGPGSRSPDDPRSAAASLLRRFIRSA